MQHLERALTGRNGFGWYVLVIIISLVAQAIAMIPIFGIIAFVYTTGDNNLDISALTSDPMALLKAIDSNVALMALMIPMAISLLVILLLIRLIHKRSFAEVVNGTKKTRWQRVGFGFGVWFIISLILMFAQLLILPETFTLQFEIAKFLPLLLISVLLIPLQTTFEEVMTRGYLAQGIGTLTKSRMVALLIPAAFFAVLHISNPEVGEYGMGIMLATYFAMALILGLTSILDDGLELAIGIHAANNMFISLLTTQKGAVFETAAVFEVAKGNPYIEFAVLLLAGSIAITIFYRKYGWTWDTINIRIEKQEDIDLSVK